MASPIFPQAEALTTALQPANVQMAMLVDLVKKLHEETQKATKASEEHVNLLKRASNAYQSLVTDIQFVISTIAAIPEVLAAVAAGIEGAMAFVAATFASISAVVEATVVALGGSIEGITVVIGASIALVDALIAAIPALIAEVIALPEEFVIAVVAALAAIGIALATLPFIIAAAAVAAAATTVVAFVAAAATVVATILGAVGAIVGSIMGAIAAVRSILGPFVGAWRPDLMQKFKLIVDDLMASIGEQLVPIMQVANAIFRMIGDTIAGLTGRVLPFMQKFADAVGRLASALIAGIEEVLRTGAIDAFMDLLIVITDDLVEVIVAMVPGVAAVAKGLLNMLGVVLELVTVCIRGATIVDMVTGAIKILSEVLVSFVEMLIRMANKIRAMLGLKPIESERLQGDSRGKSAQPASFTSTDAIWKAMMVSTSGRADPQLTATLKTNDWLRQIYDKVGMSGSTTNVSSPSASAATVAMATDQWRLSQLIRT